MEPKTLRFRYLCVSGHPPQTYLRMFNGFSEWRTTAVTTLTFAAVLYASILTGEKESYEEAHKASTETGRPMVVMVSASWCPACKSMEKEVLPEVERQGGLTQVSFAKVDLDKDQKLGQQLTKGGPIPQLIMYRKTRRGWLLRRLIGRQSVTRVQSFITEGLTVEHGHK
jgi:thiol-disulfide isomerase/thioredoxin